MSKDRNLGDIIDLYVSLQIVQRTMRGHMDVRKRKVRLILAFSFDPRMLNSQLDIKLTARGMLDAMVKMPPLCELL
jgi:hypothetical protein